MALQNDKNFQLNTMAVLNDAVQHGAAAVTL